MAARDSVAQKVTPLIAKKRTDIFVGVDDGNYGIKLVLEDGTCHYMPSRAARGHKPVVGLTGEGNHDCAYTVGEQQFTVVENYALIPAEDPRHMGEPYPVSALNRVLVHHAMLRAGLGDQDCTVVTGLPIDDFYIAGQKNVDLIDRKIVNLLNSPITNKNPSVALPRIVNHRVISEGIAAYFDLLLDFHGNEDPETLKLVRSRALAVIDVVGSTTDIAVIAEGGTGIYADRSGTKRVGALNLNTRVGARLRNEFKLADEPPATHIEQAIQSKTYQLFGTEHDVSGIVDAEANTFASEIIAAMYKLVGQGHDVGSVVFVGGGSILLKPAFEKVYANHSIFPNEPQFANGRGMLKAAKFVLQW